MVKEAKAKLECRVTEIKPLGTGGGAGNLVICEVLYIHIADEVLNEDHTVNPAKLHLAARLGGDFYGEINRENLFKLPKPGKNSGIGVDNLPDFIRNSNLFSCNDLARLAMIERLPEFDPLYTDARINAIVSGLPQNKKCMKKEICAYASELLNQNQLHKAWQVVGKMQWFME